MTPQSDVQELQYLTQEELDADHLPVGKLLPNGATVAQEAQTVMQTAAPSSARKRRSDAGKPRPAKPSKASVTLGVTFDISDQDGIERLTRTFKFWMDEGYTDEVQAVAAELLRRLAKYGATKGGAA